VSRLVTPLIGGTKIVRHGLAWYFTTLSQVSVVYGSLTTAIVVLLSDCRYAVAGGCAGEGSAVSIKLRKPPPTHADKRN
jgi:hypothetical protein